MLEIAIKKRASEQSSRRSTITIPDDVKKITVVQFSDDIQYIESTSEEPPAFKEIWYSRSEMNKIRKKNKKIAVKFLKQRLFEGKNALHTFRGLESFNKGGFRESSYVLGRSITAVLAEQDRQRDEGIFDAELILKTYLDNGAKECQEKASVIGESDYKSALQCNSDEDSVGPEISKSGSLEDPMKKRRRSSILKTTRKSIRKSLKIRRVSDAFRNAIGSMSFSSSELRSSSEMRTPSSEMRTQ